MRGYAEKLSCSHFWLVLLLLLYLVYTLLVVVKLNIAEKKYGSFFRSLQKKLDRFFLVTFFLVSKIYGVCNER